MKYSIYLMYFEVWLALVQGIYTKKIYCVLKIFPPCIALRKDRRTDRQTKRIIKNLQLGYKNTLYFNIDQINGNSFTTKSNWAYINIKHKLFKKKTFMTRLNWAQPRLNILISFTFIFSFIYLYTINFNMRVCVWACVCECVCMCVCVSKGVFINSIKTLKVKSWICI